MNSESKRSSRWGARLSQRGVRGMLRTLVTTALIGLVGWFVARAVFGAVLDGARGGGVVEAIVLVPCLVLVLFAVLAVHEGGHLLGGWISGFQALLFVVGPVRLERRTDGWSLGFNRILALWGGLAASAPQDTENLPQRTLWMVAGGPITSLAVGILGLLMSWALPLPSPAPEPLGGIASLGLFAFATGSLAIGAVTLVPATTSGFHTDGARILRFLRGGREAAGEASLLAVVGLSMGGTRPRDWPPDLVEGLLHVPPGGAMGVASRQLAFMHALDRGETAEARDHLESALAQRNTLPAPLRPGLLSQGAFFAAFHERDPARARRLLHEVSGPSLGAEHQVDLAQAAVHQVEGDYARAEELAGSARARLRTAMDRGTARAETDWLDELAQGRIKRSG